MLRNLAFPGHSHPLPRFSERPAAWQNALQLRCLRFLGPKPVSPSPAPSPCRRVAGPGNPQILRLDKQHQSNFPGWGWHSATSTQAPHWWEPAVGKSPEERMHLVAAEQCPWVSYIPWSWMVIRSGRPGAARYGHLPVTRRCPGRKEEGAETLREVAATAREVMGSSPWQLHSGQLVTTRLSPNPPKHCETGPVLDPMASTRTLRLDA